MLNIPLLIIRVYIASTYNDSISVFLVKNILGSLFAIMEIYDCSFDLLELKKSDNVSISSTDHNDSKKELDVSDIELKEPNMITI